MKKLLIYIITLIVITASIFFVLKKNFPPDIVEINFESIIDSRRINEAVNSLYLYDYLNLYDISFQEKNAKLYSGNINILLRNKDIEDIGITLKDNEVLIGDKFMKKNFKYNLLGETYTSIFGDFAVNAIIKNDDNVYYRNLDFFDAASVKKQILYLSLMSTKGRTVSYKNTIESLRYFGINVEKSIHYADVVNFFLKVLVLLILTALVIVFLMVMSLIKKIATQIKDRQKSFSYELELHEFVLKTENFQNILKLLAGIFIEIAIIFAVLYFTIIFLNTPFSYEIDFTSLDSVLNAIKAFLSLMKFYILNGFTNISLAIIKCIMIYTITLVVIIAINLKKLFIKLKKAS